MKDLNGGDYQDVLFRKEIYSDNDISIPVEVAHAVAHVSGKEVLELEPLYTYVDSDALRDLMDTDSYLDITFNYEGYEVNIEGAGIFVITIMDE